MKRFMAGDWRTAKDITGGYVLISESIAAKAVFSTWPTQENPTGCPLPNRTAGKPIMTCLKYQITHKKNYMRGLHTQN